MVYFARATLRFDGACQPNPGEGGAGFVAFNNNNGNTIVEGQHYVGDDCTNNVAEYFGLIEGLKRLRDSYHTVGHLTIEGDSELVINHMNGTYSVNSHRLRPLYSRAWKLIESCRGRDFDSYDFCHIDRWTNERADELARQAIYEGQDWWADYY